MVDLFRTETRMRRHVTARIGSVALGVALLVGTPTACSSGSPSINELRAKTRSALVKGGMSRKQADCYVKSLPYSALRKFGKGDPSAAKDPAVSKRVSKCFERGN